MKIRMIIISVVFFVIAAIFSFNMGWFHCSSDKSIKKELYSGLPGNTRKTSSLIERSNVEVNLGSIVQFTRVYHYCIIKNDKKEPMKINKASVARGKVILLNYNKEILPGKDGYIKIMVPTNLFAGNNIDGMIILKTSDKSRPFITIYIKGEIIKFAEVDPQKIILKKSDDGSLTGSAKIVPEEKYPFKIVRIKPRDGSKINYSYKQLNENNKKTYIISVKSVGMERGLIRDILFIETDSTVQPEISIRVSGFMDK